MRWRNCLQIHRIQVLAIWTLTISMILWGRSKIFEHDKSESKKSVDVFDVYSWHYLTILVKDSTLFPVHSQSWKVQIIYHFYTICYHRQRSLSFRYQDEHLDEMKTKYYFQGNKPSLPHKSKQTIQILLVWFWVW